MNTKTLFLAALIVGFSCASAGAQDVYKVSLLDGMEILSATAPVASGSMLLVKKMSDGTLTAVPSELVSNVSKARTTGSAFATAFATKTVKMKTVNTPLPTSRLVTVTDTGTSAKSVIVLPAGQKVSRKLTTAKMADTLGGANLATTLATDKQKLSGTVNIAKTESGLTLSVDAAKGTAEVNKASTMKLASPLGPGQQIFLGPTGGTSTAATRLDTIVVAPRAGVSAASALSVDPLGASIREQIFAGDLPRLTPRSGLTAGTVTPTAGEVVIGPNGFPVPVTATTANAVPIGPNGFPDFTAARTGIQPVSTNGFPATATAVSPTGLTRAGGSITTALPVTITPATAATAGAISVPATSATAVSAATPAAASPR
ncbi:MAG: hypothetical protein M3542_00965 [Acidobacteriota bacterium]|nr:hypothetical protein [Acidobacteriota bacterium]MDQ5872603.1 hypothetical protein [Acidobacteriota bacterium]